MSEVKPSKLDKLSQRSVTFTMTASSWMKLREVAAKRKISLSQYCRDLVLTSLDSIEDSDEGSENKDLS